MATISQMIDLVWQPPRKEPGVKRPHIDRTLPENFKYYGNWGFTIYRTYYGPDSDKNWEILLDALKRQTNLALGYYQDRDKEKEKEEWEQLPALTRAFYEDRDEDGNDLKRIKELFFLDPRENPSLLDGLDVRQLRQVCFYEHLDAEKSMAGVLFRFVLVADESVLKDVANGEFVVKAVAYDWEEGDESWGWMRIPTGYLLELWNSLMLWRDNTHRVLRYDDEEEGLRGYIWPGEDAADPTSACSEVRCSVHYESQRPRYGLPGTK